MEVQKPIWREVSALDAGQHWTACCFARQRLTNENIVTNYIWHTPLLTELKVPTLCRNNQRRLSSRFRLYSRRNTYIAGETSLVIVASRNIIISIISIPRCSVYCWIVCWSREFLDDCFSLPACVQWQAIVNQNSVNGVNYPQYTRLIDCQAFCASYAACVALDFDQSSTPCWIHTNAGDLDADKTFNLQGVTQFIVNRTCSPSSRSKSDFGSSQFVWAAIDA